MTPVNLSFVCLGNICRSPTAEAVMAHLVEAAGLEGWVEVDSAGTAGWHVGDPPDDRSTAEARRRGVAMRSRGRQFQRADFDRFDLVLAMDRKNHALLRGMAGRDAHRDKVRLLREFSSTSPGPFDVPDPYYGGAAGFAEVFDLVEDACRGLLDHLVATYRLPVG